MEDCNNITHGRHAMSKRTVYAVQNEDGHLELLEPVEVPKGVKFPVTLDLPDEAEGKAEIPVFPTQRLGRPKGKLTRDEIYGDII